MVSPDWEAMQQSKFYLEKEEEEFYLMEYNLTYLNLQTLCSN